MSDAKWNSFPHLIAAELADDDQIPVSDSSQPEGEKDATTTIAALRDAVGGGGGVPATGFTAMVALEESEYDALDPPDASTLYFVLEDTP